MNVIVPPRHTHLTPSQCSCVRGVKDVNVIVSFAQMTLVCAQMTRIYVYRLPGSVCTDDRRLCVQMTRICVYR